MSLEVFQQVCPQGKVPRSSKDHGKVFVCRRGCNTRTATYTEEFVWEEVYRSSDDIHNLIDLVKSGTKASRRVKSSRRESPHVLNDATGQDGDEDWEGEKTPRKLATPKKPRSYQGTPKKSKPVTPSSHRK